MDAARIFVYGGETKPFFNCSWKVSAEVFDKEGNADNLAAARGKLTNLSYQWINRGELGSGPNWQRDYSTVFRTAFPFRGFEDFQ
jgi:hypothetical protein